MPERSQKFDAGLKLLIAGAFVSTSTCAREISASSVNPDPVDIDNGHVLDIGTVKDHLMDAGIVISAKPLFSPEQQEQLSNPFVLKQAVVELPEGSFFLSRPDGVIKEVSEDEIIELALNQQYLLLLAEQTNLTKDVSQNYALDNPQFFHNIYIYKEGDRLSIIGVTIFKERSGRQGVVFKDITDFAMPFYIQYGDNFGAAKLPDGRMIPYYKNDLDPGSYTLTVGESLEPTSASLMEIPQETRFERLEPIAFPQSITPKGGRVNVRQRPSTGSRVLTTIDSNDELPALGVVNMPGTGLWHAVPFSSQEGTLMVGFVSSEVTMPQEQTAQGNLLITPVPQDLPTGYNPEIAVDTFNETAAIYEIASFYERPQMQSTNGRYTLYYSQNYLREEARANNFVFDQGAVDSVTDLIFEKSFNELNQILASQRKPAVAQTDSVILRPFVQRGSTIVNTNSIEGIISKIKHYVVTFEEMEQLRKAIQDNPDAVPTIDLYMVNRLVGFAFFGRDGSLVMVTHPGRIRSSKREIYLSWHILADGPVKVYSYVGDALIYGEAGMGIYRRKTYVNDIYNNFGCYSPSWNCNPNLVSIQ